METKTIYLIRHAAPFSKSKEKYFLGQADPALSLLGMQQAEQLSCALAGRNLNFIYCSDLLRAEQTALIIAKRQKCQVEKVKELREIKMGEWEELSFAKVRELYPAEFKQRGENIKGYRPPGGESFADLALRVVPCFDKISENSKGDIAIVAHAGVNRVLLCYLLGIPLNNILTIHQAYAQVTMIQKRAGSYIVQCMNRPLKN